MHHVVDCLLLFVLVGSYPGATATRIQADYDSSDRLVKEAEKKLRDTAQAFEKMKVARGLGGGADQVNTSI